MLPADFAATWPNHVRGRSVEGDSVMLYDFGDRTVFHGDPVIILRDNKVVRFGFLVLDQGMVSIRDPNTAEELEASCSQTR